MSRYLFTSESVTEGHPDKVSDAVSDAVLDAALAGDKYSRVACETLCRTGFVVIAGEITTKSQIDFGKVARNAIKDIGYTSSEMGFDADTWFGFYAPASTPPEVVARLNREINKVLATPAVKERINALGGVPAPMSPADFNARAATDSARFGALIKARNITGD